MKKIISTMAVLTCCLASCMMEDAGQVIEDQPVVVYKGSCSSTADCLYGPDATCDGSSVCYPGVDDQPRRRGYAICDGQRSYCPPPPSAETCDDGADNDNDGKVDCVDSDCSGDPSCGLCQEYICEDECYYTGGNWNGNSCVCC